MDRTTVEKPELLVFSQNVVGGVQSYYYNLLSHDAENRFSKTWILADDLFNNNPRPKQPYDTGYEKLFKYRSDTNLFHILKELQKLISNRPGMVLASFPLELAALHVYRKKNKTIAFVCHDEYFLQFAKQYDFLIDVFIVHNPHFIGELQKLLPHRKQDVYYLPYGITLSKDVNTLNTTAPLRLIVIARMQKSKGVLDIPLLIDKLRAMAVPFTLTMVGDGPEREVLEKQLSTVPGITFAQPATTAALMALIQQHDVFVLPSYLDGMPVSLMETMSCGLVPVLSDFNEGIKQVVTGDKGYVLPKGNIEAFASAIATLANDRNFLSSMRENVLSYARTQFNAAERAKDYYDFFAGYNSLKKPVRRKYIRYGNMIDHPMVPPFIHKNYYRFMKLKRKLLGA